jgi:hypothetical protein
MKTKRLTGFLALAFALLALPLSASTFVAMDDVELVAAADGAIVGEVLEVHSFWNDNGTLIVTEARLLVHDVVFGDAPAEVTVRTFGGQVAGYGVEAHGFPTFEVGQTQLVVLEKAGDGSLRVAGYRQGQFEVQTRTDGTAVAVPMVGDARFLTRDGQIAPRPKAMTLANLKNHFRTVRGELDALGAGRATLR